MRATLEWHEPPGGTEAIKTRKGGRSMRAQEYQLVRIGFRLFNNSIWRRKPSGRKPLHTV